MGIKILDHNGTISMKYLFGGPGPKMAQNGGTQSGPKSVYGFASELKIEKTNDRKNEILN